MAFSKTTLPSSSWTLIGNNVSAITFQNIGQQQIYINVTATNVAPTAPVGLVYDIFQGELNISPTTLSNALGRFVWARAVTGVGSVVVDI
jgi:hypothetical protein